MREAREVSLKREKLLHTRRQEVCSLDRANLLRAKLKGFWRSGSSPTRLGLPQKASSTPFPRSSPSTFGAHPLPFSPLPSSHLSPSTPHQPPVLASLPFPPPLLPPLPALLASLHSLLLHNRQVAQFSMPCAFLADIACHYVSMCRHLISLSPPLHFPAATGEST